MARRSTLRASDADREQVAERLRHATGEGRLLAEELEERLEAVFSARTYGELDAVVADLPGVPAPARQRERSWTTPRLHPVPIIAVFLVAPVVVALAIAAVVVVTTLFAVWAVLLAVGWFVFAQGRHHYRGRHGGSLPAYGRWPGGRPGPRARPRSYGP
jgi:hypothetical protein